MSEPRLYCDARAIELRDALQWILAECQLEAPSIDRIRGYVEQAIATDAALDERMRRDGVIHLPELAPTASVDRVLETLTRNGWRPARSDESGGQWIDVMGINGEGARIRCVRITADVPRET